MKMTALVRVEQEIPLALDVPALKLEKQDGPPGREAEVGTNESAVLKSRGDAAKEAEKAAKALVGKDGVTSAIVIEVREA
jgi:hypothetical protein